MNTTQKTVDDTQVTAIIFSKTDSNQFIIELRHRGEITLVKEHGEARLFTGMDDVKDFLRENSHIKRYYLALDNTYDEFGDEKHTVHEGISHHYMPFYLEDDDN